jgi:hypothetical protein
VWLELVLAAQDLTCWLQTLLLDGELAIAEPKRLRTRLLRTAGRLLTHARRLTLHLPAAWPWASVLATAFTQLWNLLHTPAYPLLPHERPRPQLPILPLRIELV